MASSAPQIATEAHAAETTEAQGTLNLEEQELAVDLNEDTDSAYGASVGSETTSIAEQYKGYLINGRRFQNVSSKEYFQPSDDKQWGAMEAGHLVMLILDSQRTNTLFRSPVTPKWQHVLDIGTGSGDWALDVADRYADITVHGIDLFPPPHKWVPPNLIFEVDDVSQENWTWHHKFDMVYMRHMLGSFSDSDWNKLYKRIYDNLEPGGWIEQVELDVDIRSVDDSLPEDSPLRWGKMFAEIGEKSGRPFDIQDRMEGKIGDTGFINVQKQEYKVPIGTWPQLKVYKDAGRVNKTQILQGMEGWTMYLLSKHGLPTPWSPEEVQVWLAKCRNDVNKGYRIYQRYVRVWAQKPYDAAPPAQHSEPVVEKRGNSAGYHAGDSSKV